MDTDLAISVRGSYAHSESLLFKDAFVAGWVLSAHLHDVPHLVVPGHEGERADEGQPVRARPGNGQPVGAADVAVEGTVADCGGKRVAR